MNCKWLKVTPNVQKGIQILNSIEDSKFEAFLKRIGTRLRLRDAEIFTEEEKKKLQIIFKVDEDTLITAIKTLIYLYKRLLKFIFMPVNLHKDLISVGFKTEKAVFIVKSWSSEVSSTLNDFVCNSMDKVRDSKKFSWKLNTELCSDIQKKCKIPKAYLTISNEKTEQEMELTHSDLYTMFIQFEAIQNELDSSVL